MFWHFLKVVYSRACESRGVWIKVRKLKEIKSVAILKNFLYTVNSPYFLRTYVLWMRYENRRL